MLPHIVSKPYSVSLPVVSKVKHFNFTVSVSVDSDDIPGIGQYDDFHTIDRLATRYCQGQNASSIYREKEARFYLGFN